MSNAKTTIVHITAKPVPPEHHEERRLAKIVNNTANQGIAPRETKIRDEPILTEQSTASPLSSTDVTRKEDVIISTGQE